MASQRAGINLRTEEERSLCSTQELRPATPNETEIGRRGPTNLFGNDERKIDCPSSLNYEVVLPDEEQDPLGYGGFGSVYLTPLRSDSNVKLATKIVDPEVWEERPWNRDLTLQEIEIHRQVDMKTNGEGHQQIVKFKHAAYGDHNSPIYITMEYAPEGSLKDWLAKRNGAPLPLDTIWFIVHQTVVGLLFLRNEIGYLHRDVKLSNTIVVGEDQKGRPLIKLIDFGTACQVNNSKQYPAMAGSTHHIPPERRRQKNLTLTRDLAFRGDVYSLGVMVLTLFGVVLPNWDDNKLWIPDAKIIRGRRKKCHRDETRVISNMLQPDPSLRCTLEHVLEKATVFAKLDPAPPAAGPSKRPREEVDDHDEETSGPVEKLKGSSFSTVNQPEDAPKGSAIGLLPVAKRTRAQMAKRAGGADEAGVYKKSEGPKAKAAKKVSVRRMSGPAARGLTMAKAKLKLQHGD